MNITNKNIEKFAYKFFSLLKKKKDKKCRDFKDKENLVKKVAPSIIVSDLDIAGNLSSDGIIEIGGKVRGDIKSNIVVIRKEAIINGTISANTVMVYGNVRGPINAKEIKLYSTANVVGKIEYEKMSMEIGALFNGECIKISIQQQNLLDIGKHIHLSAKAS